VDVHLALEPSRGPLSRQIYEQIRDAILAGRLRPGDRLPPTRTLASSVGVSRNTVAAAFDHLTGEGFLVGRAGVGTFVSADVRIDARTQPSRASPLRVASVWTCQPESVPQLTVGQAAFDFQPGTPDVSRFPFPTWRRQVNAALRESRLGGTVYADPAGDPALRRAIARHLAVSRGVRVEADDLVVTSGVQQAATLAGQVLLEPGDVVAMEDPGYLPVRRVFEAARATVVDVPVDENGIVVEAMPEQARLVYVSPAHQFPLGVVMSLPRRLALLDWAGRAGAAILEDDYDADFRYTGRPVDPLQALDSIGRVIYVGSFSKSMLPILRLGYCVVPSPLVAPFRRAKFVADWHSPLSSQAALARFIDDGHLANHIRRMRRIYQTRRDRIAAALDSDLGPWLRRVPTVAGLHLAALARSAGAERVEEWVARARELDVAVQSLTTFTHSEERPAGLVIGFGAIPESRIDEGMRRLRRALSTG
jgi:GntR family transcriptional regulator / MocR family aminotransferase